MRRVGFAKGLLETSGAQGFALVTGMVVLTITARWLGPTGRGIIAGTTAWTTLFMTLGHLSFGQVAIYRATRLRNTDWLSETFGTLVILCLVVCVISWAIAGVLYFGRWRHVFGELPGDALLVAFIGLPLLIWDQYGGALLMTVGELRLYNAARVIGRTFVVALVLLAWFMRLGVVGVVAATVIGQGIGRIVGLSGLWAKAGRRIRWSAIVARELFTEGMKLHLNYIGDFFLSQVNVLLVNSLLGTASTGELQVAQYLITVLTVVPQSAGILLFNRIAELGPDAAWKQQRKVTGLLMAGMAVLSVVSAVVAPWLIPLVLGAKFVPSVHLFRILLLAAVPMTLVKLMLPQWIGRGFFLTMSFITIGLGLLNLGVVYLLVPRLGLDGMAWATVVVYAVALVAQIGMLLHCERRATYADAQIAAV